MRRKDKEVIDPQKIEAIIESALILRVALFDDLYPYVVPVNFGYHEGRLYFHSATEGKKLDLIRRNNRVCFEAEADLSLIKGAVPCKWSMSYASVIGFGRASFIEDPEEKIKGLAVIFRHYSDDPFEIPDDSLARFTVIKIEVESMTGKISGKPGEVAAG